MSVQSQREPWRKVGLPGGPGHRPTSLSREGSRLLSAAPAFTGAQKMLRCSSRIFQRTIKRRAGAVLAACVYFSPFEKRQSWKRGVRGGRALECSGAAGTCPGRRNARKTRHAALAAVCIHSPSRCRQLLMPLSKFNVTFFSLLLLFLAGLLFSLLYFISFFFPAASLQPLAYIITVRLPETGIPTGKSILSKQPRICIFSCFLIVAKPSFTKESFSAVPFP